MWHRHGSGEWPGHIPEYGSEHVPEHWFSFENGLGTGNGHELMNLHGYGHQ